MGKCFIIQPFDGGPFDKRYEDIIAPAVTAARLDPYRVDRDPSVSIPIEDIEAEIRASDACLAEITLDNPNVWFELGFAIASQKEVVLVCSTERKTRFPFDVQHRSIIRYATDSSRDFEELGKKITSRLEAILKKEEHLSQVASMSPLTDIQGLAQHEIVALVAIAQNLHSLSGNVPGYLVRGDMEKAGFTRIATTLSLTSLIRSGMVEEAELYDDNQDNYIAYSLTPKGMDWLLHNQDRLVLRTDRPKTQRITDDDIPF
jgi:nucleoside 2-deoxyribosyltransferase